MKKWTGLLRNSSESGSIFGLHYKCDLTIFDSPTWPNVLANGLAAFCLVLVVGRYIISIPIDSSFVNSWGGGHLFGTAIR